MSKGFLYSVIVILIGSIIATTVPSDWQYSFGFFIGFGACFVQAIERMFRA